MGTSAALRGGGGSGKGKDGGGGGLLYTRFQSYFKTLREYRKSGNIGKLIAWGMGQQSYNLDNLDNLAKFEYNSYLDSFDLSGIRDYGQALPWLPCASCMHPAFDRPRKIKHELVVFSHKKFQVNIPGLPRLTNANQSFEQVLDFLGSGETIITSSYHGAYWGILLGRKVLAFPFSTKFYTFKHLPTLYPSKKWKQASWKFLIFKKQIYQHWYKNKFFCDCSDWQTLLKDCQAYPDSLEECRKENQKFYEQCLEMLLPNPSNL